MFVVGVDGCRGGWVAVALCHGSFAGATAYGRFRDLLDGVPEAVTVGVDVPIGLTGDTQRLCDTLAQERLGPRRSSVFLIPPRPVVAVEDYDDANTLCRELTGKGLSRQAHALRRRILEVDDVLRAQARHQAGADRAPLISKPPGHPARRQAERPESPATLRRHARIVEPDGGAPVRDLRHRLPAGRVIEVHPELSFREMAGAPLELSKKSEDGIQHRRALLAAAGIHIPDDLQSVGGVAVDDLLDAAAAAWTAHRYADQRARSVPPPELWQYDGARAIAIWS